MSNQTRLGTQRIKDAQKAAGLSNEAVARAVPISEKTWRRWKERGEIPTAALPAIAKILGLEINGRGHDFEAEFAEVRQALAGVRETQAATERIEAMLRELLARPRGGEGRA